MKANKLVYGVGINDADYVVKVWETIGYVKGVRKERLVWECPYYRTWTSMLKRCYSTKYQERKATYKGCTVSEEWLTFSNFRSWMENQEWEGKQLDKDLLFKGNKVYSAETCVFVSRLVNGFIVDQLTARGEYLIGVTLDSARGKFRSQCSNPFTGGRGYIGIFNSEIEAHQAWLKRKLELAQLLASEQTDERVAKALIDRYTNYEASI